MILHKNKGNNYSLFNSLDSQIKNIKFFNNFYFKIHYVHQANAFKTSKRYFKGSRLLRFPNGVCSTFGSEAAFGVLPSVAKQRGAASSEAKQAAPSGIEAAFGRSSSPVSNFISKVSTKNANQIIAFDFFKSLIRYPNKNFKLYFLFIIFYFDKIRSSILSSSPYLPLPSVFYLRERSNEGLLASLRWKQPLYNVFCRRFKVFMNKVNKGISKADKPFQYYINNELKFKEFNTEESKGGYNQKKIFKNSFKPLGDYTRPIHFFKIIKKSTTFIHPFSFAPFKTLSKATHDSFNFERLIDKRVKLIIFLKAAPLKLPEKYFTGLVYKGVAPRETDEAMVASIPTFGTEGCFATEGRTPKATSIPEGAACFASLGAAPRCFATEGRTPKAASLPKVEQENHIRINLYKKSFINFDLNLAKIIIKNIIDSKMRFYKIFFKSSLNLFNIFLINMIEKNVNPDSFQDKKKLEKVQFESSVFSSVSQTNPLIWYFKIKHNKVIYIFKEILNLLNLARKAKLFYSFLIKKKNALKTPERYFKCNPMFSRELQSRGCSEAFPQRGCGAREGCFPAKRSKQPLRGCFAGSSPSLLRKNTEGCFAGSSPSLLRKNTEGTPSRIEASEAAEASQLEQFKTVQDAASLINCCENNNNTDEKPLFTSFFKNYYYLNIILIKQDKNLFYSLKIIYLNLHYRIWSILKLLLTRFFYFLLLFNSKIFNTAAFFLKQKKLIKEYTLKSQKQISSIIKKSSKKSRTDKIQKILNQGLWQLNKKDHNQNSLKWILNKYWLIINYSLKTSKNLTVYYSINNNNINLLKVFFKKMLLLKKMDSNMNDKTFRVHVNTLRVFKLNSKIYLTKIVLKNKFGLNLNLQKKVTNLSQVDSYIILSNKKVLTVTYFFNTQFFKLVKNKVPTNKKIQYQPIILFKKVN
jgi:hypothetical protein